MWVVMVMIVVFGVSGMNLARRGVQQKCVDNPFVRRNWNTAFMAVSPASRENDQPSLEGFYRNVM
jgi:uncharacterized protein YneF (UPF0154 family)